MVVFVFEIEQRPDIYVTTYVLRPKIDETQLPDTFHTEEV